MTRDECVTYLRSRGRYYADQPLTVERAVYDAHEARMAGMLRALEAHATSIAVQECLNQYGAFDSAGVRKSVGQAYLIADAMLAERDK